MKKNLFLLIAGLFVCVVLAGIADAQEREGANSKPMPCDSLSITEEQKTAATSILSKYKASTLSIEDAKTIHKAMRDIGIQGGPAEDELIKSAGIDVEMLKKLDPPPDRSVENKTLPDDSASNTRTEKYR